jgi:hypothetical protein
MNCEEYFTDPVLEDLFPPVRADEFFDALYGDAEEGPYDIRLKFKGQDKNRLHFEFQLKQRPGKCLACSVTYGLPSVFSRHPIINLNGLVERISKQLNGSARFKDWELGYTQVVSSDLHAIPFTLLLAEDQSL